MATVNTMGYPIFVLTMQNEDNIVKQINAYVLSLDNQEDDIEKFTEYFSEMGGKNLKHIVVEDIFDMSYCETHLKINGLVL